MEISRIVKKITLAYLIMLSLFTVSLIFVHCIPVELMKENIRESEELIDKEGAYHKIFNFKLFQLDNYTDALMINLAASANCDSAVEASMVNVYYTDGGYFEMAKNGIKIIDDQTNELNKLSYARYWHGYQVVLRPLLTFTNYLGIRFLNYFLLFGLAIATCYLLWTKLGKIESALFVLSLLCVNFPMVPLSMQFSTCFYISFISMILVMSIATITNNVSSALTTFFVIGGVIAYFDFLTTPQLTLGLPLICMMIQKKSSSCKLIICCCIAWALGYGILWASKWLVGYLLTGNNILESAIERVELRTSNLYKGQDMTILNIIMFLWKNIVDKGIEWVVYVGVVVLFALCIVYYKYQKGPYVHKKYSWLLLIMAIVPVWFVILRNHSLQHGWFTWRAGMLTLYSVLLWVYFTTRNCKTNNK